MKKLFALGLLLMAIAVGVAIGFRLNRPAPLSAQELMQPLPVETRKQLWTCGMHPQVIQDHPGLCPICHMKLTPLMADDADEGAGGKEKKVAYWWDPMLGPSSIANHPGKSAMGMDLVPVYEAQAQAGPVVRIDPAVVQNMGIRTFQVTRGPLARSVRTIGILEAPETGLHDISLRVGGWIVKLYANQEGMHIHQGEPLFDLYSPDLMVAEEELIGAVKSLRVLGTATDPSLKASSETLVESAKEKLRLLEVSQADIDAVASTLVAPRTVTFRSPASGAVIQNAVVEGSSIQAGQKLMRIEDHSVLWLQLQIYEDQIDSISTGEAVEATFEAFPGKTFTGQITFVHPHVEQMTRTLMARAVLNNPELSLRPGMYASAVIRSNPLRDAIQVPREAVIDTGTHQVAFVVSGAGHFEPRTVHMGLSGDGGQVEIIDGLTAGEMVVTSGEFLLDVESRTTEAIEKLRSSPAVNGVTPSAAPSGEGMRP